MVLSREDYAKAMWGEKIIDDINTAKEYVQVYLSIIQNREGYAEGNLQYLTAKDCAIASIKKMQELKPIPIEDNKISSVKEFHEYWNRILEIIHQL